MKSTLERGRYVATGQPVVIVLSVSAGLACYSVEGGKPFALAVAFALAEDLAAKGYRKCRKTMQWTGAK